MKKQYLYLLLLSCLFFNACNAQVEQKAANPPASILEVISIPSTSTPNLLNDTSLVSQYIRSIFQDSKGNYWFGPAFQSVARYDGQALKYFGGAEFFRGNPNVNQDNGNSVHAITEDQSGNIWFGTDHGAVKYDGKTFKNYTEINGLSNTRVSRKSILTDQSGQVWVGTQGGVFQYHPAADSTGGQCFLEFDLLPPINVKDILEDQTGNLWFASQEQGVFRYDGETIENIIVKEGLGDNYTGGIAQDKNGDFWFTMKNGICHYDGKTFTEITKEDGLGGREIWGVFAEQSGIIWITARGSTTRYDPSIPISDPTAFTVFTPEDGLNCCVQSMYQDRSGDMWWGTVHGVFFNRIGIQINRKCPR